MNIFRYFAKLYISLLILVGVIAIGILGYMNIEGYSFVDALYMTVITVSTVGFGEVTVLSEAGRLFTVFLILLSFGTFAYAGSAITRYVLDGEFRTYFKYNKLNKQVSKLNNHTLICGYGRNGKQAARKLTAYNQPFLIIENDPEELENIIFDGYLYVEGDATQDKTLEAAGIDRAKSMITTLPKDADNLFVVLSAHQLNPDLTIISRASSESSTPKLKTAGASNVIMPDKVGGAHMASLVITPDVVEFLDNISVEGSASINLEEISVNEIPAQYKFKNLMDIELRRATGCTVIGYKTTDGEYVINPGAETELLPNSKLFVLGRPDQIQKLNKLFDIEFVDNK